MKVKWRKPAVPAAAIRDITADLLSDAHPFGSPIPNPVAEEVVKHFPKNAERFVSLSGSSFGVWYHKPKTYKIEVFNDFDNSMHRLFHYLYTRTDDVAWAMEWGWRDKLPSNNNEALLEGLYRNLMHNASIHQIRQSFSRCVMDRTPNLRQTALCWAAPETVLFATPQTIEEYYSLISLPAMGSTWIYLVDFMVPYTDDQFEQQVQAIDYLVPDSQYALVEAK